MGTVNLVGVEQRRSFEKTTTFGFAVDNTCFLWSPRAANGRSTQDGKHYSYTSGYTAICSVHLRNAFVDD